MYQLQILHASDLEGGVDAITSAPNFAALIDAFEDDYANSVTISSGDNYIPGPFFTAAADPSFNSNGVFNDVYNQLYGLSEAEGYQSIGAGAGRIDISIMNAIGFDASALGNHEFDLGTGVIGGLLRPSYGTESGVADDGWVGTQFPFLSANLDFTGDSSLNGLYTSDILPNTDFLSGPEQSATSTGSPNVAKIAPATTIEVGGELIGVVGATTPLLATISSPGSTGVVGPTTNDMQALAEVLQPVIDELLDAGVDKIILASHLQQIALEEELITYLHGVDIVLAGGSDTLLANDGDPLQPGDIPDGAYPVVTTNADGDAALVVSTDGEYSYVGRLVVDFDDEGVLIADSWDNADSGAYASTDSTVADAWGGDYDDAFADGTKGDLVEELVEGVTAVVIEKDGNTFGSTDVFLNGERASVRTEETNLGDLTADANLWYAKEVDDSVVVSVKNGGGIRASIGELVDNGDGTYSLVPPQANPLSGKEEGEVSQLDIENSLRFNNSLTMVTLTPDQLKQVLEHSVAAVAPGATPGQFGQYGGIEFSYNPLREPGDRIENATLIDAEGNPTIAIVEQGEIVADAPSAIRVVTLSFMVDGGDSYPFPSFAEADPEFFDRVDLDGTNTPVGEATFAAPGTEQDAFAEYLAANFDTDDGDAAFDIADTPASEDERIVNLAVQPEESARPVGNDQSVKVFGDDVLEGSPMATMQGSVSSNGTTAGNAEIVAYDKDSGHFFVVGGGGVDVFGLESGALLGGLDTTQWGFANSVAVSHGLVAVAVGAEEKTDNGHVVLFTTAGEYVNSFEVGALPDMVTFTADGSRILVANEGEPNSYGEEDSVDPVGSISVIDVATGIVQTAGFEAFNDDGAELIAEGVRLYGPGASVAQDLEPEYVAIAADGKTAYVTLQENNALAVVDLSGDAPVVTEIVALGYKDHSLPGNELDASDRDGGINIQNWPVFGMYQPDAIASFVGSDGNTYLVTANEGDAREWGDYVEEERVKDLDLDPTAFPAADTLQEDENIGRLNVTKAMGDTDGDGDYDQLFALGGRSFSIWNEAGELVFDSGALIEKTIADRYPEFWDDGRSDNKGPEPESVVVGSVDGRTFAFVGLERTNATMVFDITNPGSASFIDFIETSGDISPEGLKFISAADTPDGVARLLVANEVSATTTIYKLQAPLAQDTNGGYLDYEVTTGPTKGAVEMEETGKYSYTADAGVVASLQAGQTTTDSFEVTATDDEGLTSTSEVEVTLVGVGEGTGGDDRIFAYTGDGADVARIDGRAGDDILVGGAFGDLVRGESGNDIVVGNAGEDTYFIDADAAGYEISRLSDFEVGLTERLLSPFGKSFEEGEAVFSVRNLATGETDRVQAETLAFGDRAFTVEGDALILSSSDDTYNGGAGKDVVVSGGGDDDLFGGAGGDFLVGTSGDDTLFGDSGVDQLLTTAGNDSQNGGSGNDSLVAANEDGGEVVMFGGSGMDDFVLAPLDEDSGLSLEAIIADFNRTEGDKVDLSSLRDGGGDVLEMQDILDASADVDGNLEIDLSGFTTAGGEEVVGSLLIVGQASGDLVAADFVFTGGYDLQASLDQAGLNGTL